MKRHSLVSLVLVLGVMTSSCYGPFELTHRLWKWNGSVGDKFVNEGVFLVMNIIPVYGAVAFVDAVVLNSVKFWTGKSALQARTVEQGDLKAVLTPGRDGKTIRIAIYRGGRPVEAAEIRADSDGSMRAYTIGGVALVARTSGGTVTVSRDGMVVASYPAYMAERYVQ
jgi:hypothetical protein